MKGIVFKFTGTPRPEHAGCPISRAFFAREVGFTVGFTVEERRFSAASSLSDSLGFSPGRRTDSPSIIPS
jgi:hypothetical protein